MISRRLVPVLAAFGLLLSGAVIAYAANTDTGLTPGHATVQWSSRADAGATDSRTVTVNAPANYWQRHPGGIVLRIDWPQPSSVLEIFVHGPNGHELAESIYGNVTYQQVYIASPASGSYRIDVVNAGATNSAYLGTARLVHQTLPLAAQRSGDMQFSRSLVDPQILTADPGIAADNDGRVYVTSRLGVGNPFGSFLWRSTNVGETFRLVGDHLVGRVHDPRRRPCATAVDAGADIDLTADRTGRLYLVDLGATGLAAGFSTDHGATWVCAAVPWATGSDDRPWVAAAPSADGNGPGVDAYMVFQGGAFVGEFPGGSTASPEQLRVGSTRDGGLTWQSGGSFAIGQTSIPGEFFVGRDGAVYQVFSSPNAVWLAESRDHGAHFTVHPVSQRLGEPRGDGWTAGAVDAAGVVYAAWVDQGSWSLLFTRSTDRGRHWTTPARVSPPDTTAMKVWMTAGKSGDVSLAWYGSAGTFPLYDPPTSAVWNVWSARSLDAAATRPTFHLNQVSATPVGFGSERLFDKSSLSYSLSYFGDSLRVVLAPDGGMLISYADLGSATAKHEYAYVVVARQTRGPGMSHVAAQSFSPSAPPASPVDNSCPQLRFRSAPSVSSAGADVHVTVRLASLRDLTSIPERCGASPAPRAVWLAAWTIDGHREYAGAAVEWARGNAGQVRFFGGLDSAALKPDHTDAVLGTTATSYPAAMPLSGSVNEKTAELTVVLPKSRFALRTGTALNDLQFFTMVGNPYAQTAETIFRLIDGTGPLTARLA
jgi:hypothetical protein